MLDVETTEDVVVRNRHITERMRKRMNVNAFVYPTLDTVGIAARIKALRKQSGLTNAQVAEAMGFMNEVSVCNWTSGRKLPSIDNLYALSVLFGTSVDYILNGSREERDHEPSLPVLYESFCLHLPYLSADQDYPAA